MKVRHAHIRGKHTYFLCSRTAHGQAHQSYSSRAMGWPCLFMEVTAVQQPVAPTHSRMQTAGVQAAGFTRLNHADLGKESSL